jgi:hypothetical protein
MTDQLRRIYLMRSGVECGPTDMLAIRSGEVFRMEPPLGVTDDVGCPTGWLRALDGGYTRDGVQRVECAVHSDYVKGELP